MIILQVADCLTSDCLCMLPSQTLCIITTVCTRRRGLCPATIGGCCGSMAIDWLPTEEERKQSILGRTVCLEREVASYTNHNVMQICNVDSAHGVGKSDILSGRGM